MAAPKGNQFWKLRSKHGRDAIFKDPETLMEEATKYFQWCDDNPLYETKAFNGKDEVKIVELPKMRAYTLAGLCIYLNTNTVYFNQFESTETYKNNKDFSKVLTHIREVIYTQKFTGAAADFLNANIIARDLGLSDKKEIDVHTEQPLFGPDENK